MGHVIPRSQHLHEAFQFQVKWCLDDTFQAEIRYYWPTHCSVLLTKLHGLGKSLMDRHHHHQGARKVTVTNLEVCLNELQLKKPDDVTFAELVDVQVGLNLEADREEMYWEQWSCLN